MEFLKKKWQIIVIVLLVLFGMNKCASSCTNANMYEDAQKEHTEYVQKMDSTVKVLNDSITVLNTKITVYEEKVAGLNNALSIQDEANRRISEAKKNINVNVRK
jgi:predicted RNase H-like nuclease (RuvC/YqgF family)